MDYIKRSFVTEITIMQMKYELQQHESRFTTDSTTEFFVRELTSSLVFTIHGIIPIKNPSNRFLSSESPKSKEFCGIYRWEGFKANVDDKYIAAKYEFYNFLDKLRFHFKLSERDTVEVFDLQIIGGERASENLSGTEDEVSQIHAVIKDYNFAAHNIKLHHVPQNFGAMSGTCKVISFHNFLVQTQEDAVNITLSTSRCKIDKVTLPGAVANLALNN